MSFLCLSTSAFGAHVVWLGKEVRHHLYNSSTSAQAACEADRAAESVPGWPGGKSDECRPNGGPGAAWTENILSRCPYRVVDLWGYSYRYGHWDYHWNEYYFCVHGQVVCPEGEQWDNAGQQCKGLEVVCPVAKLDPLPNDACTQALENIDSTEAQKDEACGALTNDMQNAVNCFAGKLAQTNNSATGSPIPLVRTSNRRNAAYQKHFRDIWDKMEDLVDLMKKDPAMRQACAARRAEIAAEKGCDNAGNCAKCYPATTTRRSHCLAGEPSPPTANGSSHTNGTAIDADRDQTVDPLQAVLSSRNPPETIQGFLDAPPNCNLRWLGPAPNNDPVHFQVPR